MLEDERNQTRFVGSAAMWNSAGSSFVIANILPVFVVFPVTVQRKIKVSDPDLVG